MIAQIIITSVLLAFVQHFESSSKDRVQEAKNRIPGEDVVARHGDKRIRGKMTVRDEVDAIRVRKAPTLMPLRVALFVMFFLLALLMAAGEQGSPDFQERLREVVDIHRMAAVLWLILVVQVAGAGGWMLTAGARISAYEERIEKFLIWLDGAKNSAPRKRRNRAATGSSQGKQD